MTIGKKKMRALSFLLAFTMTLWQMPLTTLAEGLGGMGAEPETVYYCGLEEHTHTEECFELVMGEGLICGLEEGEIVAGERPEGGGDHSVGGSSSSELPGDVASPADAQMEEETEAQVEEETYNEKEYSVVTLNLDQPLFVAEDGEVYAYEDDDHVDEEPGVEDSDTFEDEGYVNEGPGVEDSDVAAGHVHTEDCYGLTEVLVLACDFEEHIHTGECLIADGVIMAAEPITLYYEDSDVSITVTGAAGVIPENAELQVEYVENTESLLASIESAIPAGSRLVSVDAYDITLVADGESIQPGDEVEVIIEKKTSLVNKISTYISSIFGDEEESATAVYHVNGKRAERVSDMVEGAPSTIIFQTPHFSIYALVQTAKGGYDFTISPELKEAALAFLNSISVADDFAVYAGKYIEHSHLDGHLAAMVLEGTLEFSGNNNFSDGFTYVGEGGTVKIDSAGRNNSGKWIFDSLVLGGNTGLAGNFVEGTELFRVLDDVLNDPVKLQQFINDNIARHPELAGLVNVADMYGKLDTIAADGENLKSGTVPSVAESRAMLTQLQHMVGNLQSGDIVVVDINSRLLTENDNNMTNNNGGKGTVISDIINNNVNGAKIIFNVLDGGTSGNMSVQQFVNNPSLNELAQHVIWNFGEYTGTISFNVNFSGIVVAPKATVKGFSGNLQAGRVIAGVMDHTEGEIHGIGSGGHDYQKGRLKVSKIVQGTGGDMEKEFTFTVTLSDDSINGLYGGMYFEDGVATVTLKHGESVTATGLPPGITYTVEEVDYSEDGYETTAKGDSGRIEAGETAEAAFTNSKDAEGEGDLEVSKTVVGDNGADADKEFTFTIKLNNNTINETYDIQNLNGETIGSVTFENGKATLTLKSGETKKIVGLPAGITYTVTEEPAVGYVVTVTGGEGKIEANGTETAAFVNTKSTGDLKINKRVIDYTGTETESQQKEFTFTVTLSDTAITGDFGDVHFENGVATITLKHGETKTITGLPAGVTYTVEENTAEEGFDFNVSSENATGKIPGNGTAEAKFVNTKQEKVEVPGLRIVKKVTGTGAELDREFHFTLVIRGKDGSQQGVYINGKCDGVKIQDIPGAYDYTLNEFKFTLKNGETKTIELEDYYKWGFEYTITEDEANQEGYTTTATGWHGTFTNPPEIITVEFENHRDTIIETGDLEVSKTVTGNAGDQQKEFSFTVTLDDESINGAYGDMTFTNGVATITLKHGETATATGLLAGVGYTVTESDNDGYVVDSTGATGTITANTEAKADFTNSRYGTEVTFTGTKVIETAEGNNPIETFVFVLNQLEETEGVTTEKTIDEVSVEFDGQGKFVNTKGFEFKKITYTEPGIYTYQVKEAAADSETGAWTYDKTVYTVIVTVVENVRGHLSASVTYMVDEDSVDSIVFTNVYETKAAAVTRFNVEKQIEGDKPLVNSTFTFYRKLVDGDREGIGTGEDENWTPFPEEGDSITITGANEQYFDQLVAVKAGTYTFAIEEKRDNIFGYVFDNTTWYVTVTVEDDGQGQLHVSSVETSQTKGDIAVFALKSLNRLSTLNGLNVLNTVNESNEIPGTSVPQIVFTNVYTIRSIEVPTTSESESSSEPSSSESESSSEPSSSETESSSEPSSSETESSSEPSSSESESSSESSSSETESSSEPSSSESESSSEPSSSESEPSSEPSSSETEPSSEPTTEPTLPTNPENSTEPSTTAQTEPSTEPTTTVLTQPETTAPTQPGTPEEPPVYFDELPDPNDPETPNVVTILEDDVPRTYYKMWDPDQNGYVWFLDEDVPLGFFDLPSTGDERDKWLMLLLASLYGSMTLVGLSHRKKSREV